MKKTILVVFVLVVWVALALPGTVLAKGLHDDKIVTGGIYTLGSGETLDGSLIIFGGVVTLETDSTVTGDVVLVGGTVTIDGIVEGDVVGVGGVVTLEDDARLESNLTTVAAALNRDVNAEVAGQVITGIQIPFNFSGFRGIQPQNIPDFQVRISPLWNAVWFLFRTFLWAALAALLVMFLPNPTTRTAQAIIAQPLLAGGLGLFTAVVAPLLLIAMAVTIIGIPISLLGVLILVIAWVLGFVAVGLELGQRIGKTFNRDWPLAVAAGVGTFVLALVVNGVDALLPCIGWMVPVLVGMLAVGGVLMTRFGTQSYPPNPGMGHVSAERIASPPPEMAGEEVSKTEQA
jgi:hypothetical protein